MALINVIPAVKEYKDLKEKVKFRKLCCKESLSSFQASLLYNFLANDSKDLLTFSKSPFFSFFISAVIPYEKREFLKLSLLCAYL